MQGDLKIECRSVNELPEVVSQISQFGEDFNIWLLKGEMGAGKTTFVHSLIEQKGTLDQVSSPSFSIVNEYLTTEGDVIYHFDFFRTDSISEIFDIGIDEYLDSGNLCLIEWPELLEPYLPDRYLLITIFNPERDKRIFIAKKND